MRVAEEDATSRPAPPAAPEHDSNRPTDVPRRYPLALAVTAALWVAWLIYLLYIAIAH